MNYPKNNMWNTKNNRVQSTSSGSKTNSQTKTTNLQHLSPFASHSLAETVVSPLSVSPKTGTELPSGVRYIRQTPSSVYRPVRGRTTATVTKKREKSPEKNLRFAEPVQCTRSHEHQRADTVKPMVRNRSTSRDRKLVRPVISTEQNTTECKRFSSHNHNKVVATSPATRQTSPIFSTVDFGGDTDRNSTSRQSPTSNLTSDPIPKPRSNVLHGVSPVTNTKSTLDRQPVIKTEISTPNGTLLKRSSAVTSNVGNNGAVHRNTVSFPMQSSNGDRKGEETRLSVNVNVAVGLDCNDNRMNHFSDQRYSSNDKEMNAINNFEDIVDWGSNSDTGDGFEVKVAVRLRPFLQSEAKAKNDFSVVEMNENTVRIVNSDNDLYNRQEFGFDVCLNSSDRDLFGYADQDIVFKRMGEPLLERALEGYNVCLFAYGQTSSGKSFTMTGTESNPGIIPRFVHELYKRISNLTQVLFAVEVSYFEIYNEKIYDLLSDDKEYNKKTLRIREHPTTGPYVENLSQHNVDGFEEVMDRMRFGNRRRATASTAANADSSRSHSIFTIILSQLKNNVDEVGLDMSCSCGSRINLIDLAGSERVGHSGTSGDRLREGSLINKSLMNLGKVISKLAEYSEKPVKSGHIPYRDSALTWLLKESLGGNSQTSMIATISPAKCHLEETLSTLRYAATARKIVNFVHINEDPKTKKIRELMDTVAQLRAKLRLDSKELPKEPLTQPSSDGSKNSSFDSQSSEPKTIVPTKQMISKETNTSFVSDRRTSTKGTDISFSSHSVVDDKKKKAVTIGTNTSFVKSSPKTCSTATETSPLKPPPKPKLVSTATEMSFTETKHIDTSTNTSFVELPSRLDLMRFQKLEEQERKLLADIRRHREKIMNELTKKVVEWAPRTAVIQNGDDLSSDTLSNDYYDAQEVIEIESIESNNTYDVSKDTVEQIYGNAGNAVGSQPSDKQYSGKHSSKKKNKKKKTDDKNETNEWETDDKKTEDNSNKWPKDNWNNKLEQIKEVDVEHHVTHDKQDTYDEWGQEENKASEQNNEWSVDPNISQTSITKVDENTDDWGADGMEEQNTDWQTGADNEWGTEDNKSKDNNKSEDNNTGNDWNDDQWSQPPKKSDEKQSSGKKSDKKKDKKNKKKDKNDSNDWGTEDNNNDEDSNQWAQEEDNRNNNQSTEQNKEESNDWGTDTVDQTQDKPEDSGGWGDDTNDNNNKTDDNFDWGDDNGTDTTVINVKKEPEGGANDVDEDNW